MSDRLTMIEYHTKRAEGWLARYLELESNASKKLIEHHIELAQFHLKELKWEYFAMCTMKALPVWKSERLWRIIF